jgi:uncharacterized paraquat-inducible protein A
MFSCPTCGEPLEPVQLQQPAGLGGGSFCPKCQERLYLSFPYRKVTVTFSLALAVGLLLLMRVASVVWFIAGTILLWVPITIVLNVYSARFKPPVLKKWKPTPSFIEWFRERDRIRAPNISHENKKDS